MTTLGKQFTQRLLEAKADTAELDTIENDKDLKAIHDQLDPALQKLLKSFPMPGQKVIVMLLNLLGVPVGRMQQKRSELRDSIEAASQRIMKDSQFRLWVKKLMKELKAAKETTVTEALADELSNSFQETVYGIMHALGLPESLEKQAKAELRKSIRTTAALVMDSSKLRAAVRMVADFLGIDLATGNQSQAVAASEPKAAKLREFISPNQIPAAAQAAKQASEDEAWDNVNSPYAEAVLELMQAMGVPDFTLNYRRPALILALKRQRQNVKNLQMFLRRADMLKQILGTVSEEALREFKEKSNSAALDAFVNAPDVDVDNPDVDVDTTEEPVAKVARAKPEDLGDWTFSALARGRIKFRIADVKFTIDEEEAEKLLAAITDAKVAVVKTSDKDDDGEYVSYSFKPVRRGKEYAVRCVGCPDHDGGILIKADEVDSLIDTLSE